MKNVLGIFVQLRKGYEQRRHLYPERLAVEVAAGRARALAPSRVVERRLALPEQPSKIASRKARELPQKRARICVCVCVLCV